MGATSRGRSVAPMGRSNESKFTTLAFLVAIDHVSSADRLRLVVPAPQILTDLVVEDPDQAVVLFDLDFADHAVVTDQHLGVVVFPVG